MLWSKFGVAKLRAFTRRQQETTITSNEQLRSALRWWLRVLPARARRKVISKHLRERPVCLTYSDREGSYAGVGVAVLGTTLNSPLAAFLNVFVEVRT